MNRLHRCKECGEGFRRPHGVIVHFARKHGPKSPAAAKRQPEETSVAKAGNGHGGGLCERLKEKASSLRSEADKIDREVRSFEEMAEHIL